MAYESVDVTRAKNAINNCLNSIRHETSSDIINNLPNNSNWVADSKTTFTGAVGKLVNTRYKDLEDYLKKCLTTLDNIQSYKDLQSQNDTINYQINSKTNELNNLKYIYNKMNDKTTADAKNTKTRITNLEREIRNLNSKKEDNSGDMSRLNNSITA